jgi:D-amino-acid dehydrogenase
MKVIVLGAGIAGVTTAWYLAAGGAEVTVLDRGAEPATETSHANGGHMSTQSATPWMGPAGVREFFESRFTPERPIRLRHARDPGRLGWFARALVASRPSAYRRSTERLCALARFSREAFETVLEEQAIEACLERRGRLSVYRGDRAFARAAKHCDKAVEVLSKDEVITREPALANANVRFAGALLYPGDATGDCRRFCIELADRAADIGVTFRYGESAQRLIVEDGRCRGAVSEREALHADGCVLALGATSPAFLRSSGIHLPMIALRGYTLTAPIGDAKGVPGAFSDSERHLVFARLDERLRVAGMADFTGPAGGADPRRAVQLEHIVGEWYPRLSRAGVEHWSCLRPMTPDGPPILGKSGLPGLWLNTGLGPLGWTLGCGAGRIVADLVLGKKPPMPLDGLTLDRFH